MALSKRFLGLGFTFQATDKGLEKKLKGIQGALEGINTALSGISDGAAKASTAMGGMRQPRTSRTRTQGQPKPRGSAFQPRQPRGFQQRATAPKDQDTWHGRKRLIDVEASKTEKLFSTVSDRVFKKNSDMLKAYTAHVQDVWLLLDENGNILKQDEKRLRSIAVKMEKIRKIDESLLMRTNLTVFFKETLPRYVKNVAGSMDRFFKSVGLDFQAMVPEQLRALGGVFKSVIFPPLLGIGKKLLEASKIASVFKSIFSGGLEAKKEGIQQDIKDEIKGLNRSISGKNQNTTNSLLKSMSENMKRQTKSKESIAPLAFLLAPLALVAGAFSGLFGEVKRVVSSFKEMKLVSSGVTKAFEIASKAFSWVKELSFVQNALNKLNRALVIAGMSFESFKIWLSGLEVVQKISSIFSSFGAKLSEAGAKLIGMFKFVAENPIFMKIFSFGAKLGRLIAWPLLLVDVFKGLYDGISQEGFSLVGVIKGLAYAIDNILLNIPSWLLGKAKGFFGSDKTTATAPTTPTPTPNVSPGRYDNKLLSELATENGTQTELLNKNVAETKRTNDLLQQILDASQNKTASASSRDRAMKIMSQFNIPFGDASGEETVR